MSTVSAQHRRPRDLSGGRSSAERGAARAAGRAIACLTARLVRRGVVAVAVALAVYLVVEAVSFLVGYPDQASRAALQMWARDPSVRLISGPGTAVTTLGGFVLWDAGLFIHVIIGAWALTTTSRVLRGDEDVGRAELVLAGAVSSTRAVRAQLTVLLLACTVLGAVSAVVLGVSGAQAWGAALFGATLAGFAGAAVAVAAVTAQLFQTRGRALGAAALVFAIAFVLRLLANSGDRRAWLAWVTPFGWTDLARAFEDNRWTVLLAPLSVILTLGLVAEALRERRDTGDALLATRRAARSRWYGLASPVAFAWRSNRRMLQGWMVGIAVISGALGAMVRLLGDSLAKDPAFQQILSAVGMDLSDLRLGFAAFVSVMLAVGVGLYAAFGMGAVRAEEASGRVEQLLARPVRRLRWLGGHVLCLAGSVVTLFAVAAAAMWLGGQMAGQGLPASDIFAAVFNPLPAVAVLVSVDVLVFALAPRLTVPVGATAVVVAYVLQVVGPLLSWPLWVSALSPFHHLETVPVDPVGWSSAITMAALAALLTALGLTAFQRRDLTGA